MLDLIENFLSPNNDVLLNLNNDLSNISLDTDVKVKLSIDTKFNSILNKKTQTLFLNVLFNTIRVDQWVQLFPISYSGINKYTLTTSDNSIAIIDKNNVLKPLKSGQIYITGIVDGNDNYFPDIKMSQIINII